MARAPAALAVSLLLVLAACGGGGDKPFAQQSGDDIAHANAVDLRGLSSMRITGHITTADAQETLDLSLDTKGDCSGVVHVGAIAARLLAVRGTVWLKPNAAYFEQQVPGKGARLERALGSRWLAAGQTPLSGVCDLDNFLSEFRDNTSVHASVLGTGSVGGRPAVRIHGPAWQADVVGWVATQSPHYLLRLDVNGPQPSSLVFTDFNLPVGATTPDPADVADPSSLGG